MGLVVFTGDQTKEDTEMAASRGEVIKTILIWVFGVIGSGAFGMMIGIALERTGIEPMLGLTGGALLFAAIRLWKG